MISRETYINPLTDFGFKKLFGTEPNKALLLDFLNELLPTRHQIEDLYYSNAEQIPAVRAERKAVFDIHCKSTTGEYFIVELQRVKQEHFKDRSVYYSSFPMQAQGKVGAWNFELKAIYTICILDFIFDDYEANPDCLHEVQLKDEYGTLFYDKLTYVYIELPKFGKSLEELETKFDKWLYVFKHLAQLQKQPVALQERIFKRLFEAAKIAKFTRMERQEYEASLKEYRDYINGVDYARKQGIELGKKENMLEVAKAMKADNEPIDKIMKYTGVSEEVVNQL